MASPERQWENFESRELTDSKGHNELKCMAKSMMSEMGVKGYFTNHSLRATALSRLFWEGVDEKLIRGVTEHRYGALDSYKQECDEKNVEVSNIVQGLPCTKNEDRRDIKRYGVTYFKYKWRKL